MHWRTDVNILLSLMRGVRVFFNQQERARKWAWYAQLKKEREERAAKGDKRYLVNQATI